MHDGILPPSLSSNFSFKNIFEKKLSIWQKLVNTFKNMKKSHVTSNNQFKYFLEKHLIDDFLKNIRKYIFIKSTLCKNIIMTVFLFKIFFNGSVFS